MSRREAEKRTLESAVFKEITWLREQGFNIWYYEGIGAGSE